MPYCTFNSVQGFLYRSIFFPTDFTISAFLASLASPFSICFTIFSQSVKKKRIGNTHQDKQMTEEKQADRPLISLYRSQNTLAYCLTSSSVFPSMCATMFWMSPLPNCSLSLMKVLKSLLDQLRKACSGERTRFRTTGEGRDVQQVAGNSCLVQELLLFLLLFLCQALHHLWLWSRIEKESKNEV